MASIPAETRKNEIATRLTELAREESELLLGPAENRPLMTWTQYLARTNEIDAERRKLRKQLFDLCS
jgi:hypothetical protein